MNIVETLVKHIKESTSFRPENSVICILPWELEQVLDLYLMPRGCPWCGDTHVLSRPCEKCECIGPLNREHAEQLPRCRCGRPAATIIWQLPMCAVCASRWPSPVEPPRIRSDDVTGTDPQSTPDRESFDGLFAAMSPDAQGRAENRANGMASALDFMSAQPGEIWVVTMACKEHKGIVAEGKPFARQFGTVHPCRSGCVYERVSGADSTPSALTPDDRPCVQTVNLYGFPLRPGMKCEALQAERRALGITADIHVADAVCGLSRGGRQACHHHVYLPAPLLTPQTFDLRDRCDDVTAPDSERRPAIVCMPKRNVFGQYMPGHKCAGPEHHVKSSAEVPAVCHEDLGTMRACKHHIENPVPVEQWWWDCRAHHTGGKGYPNNVEAMIDALEHFSTAANDCELNVREGR